MYVVFEVCPWCPIKIFREFVFLIRNLNNPNRIAPSSPGGCEVKEEKVVVVHSREKIRLALHREEGKIDYFWDCVVGLPVALLVNKFL